MISKMNELWIAVCDDLEEERLSLIRMIRNWGKSRGRTVRITPFSSGDELLDACQRPGIYHILFLDVFMPGLTGVDTARRLRAAGRNMAIIYATSSVDYGVESFETQASDYLVKPFRESDVANALDWCLEHLPEPLRTLSVNSEGEWQELTLDSIQYIEVLNHHCHIHTLRRTVVVRRGLDDLEAAIANGDFLRCHRSYLVNMNHVQSVGESDFRMTDGTLVPVSSTNRVKIRNAFIDWTYRKAWEQP